MTVRLSFHGAASTVTGSCYLVEHDRGRFLVDCGMFQGTKTIRELNYREWLPNMSPDQAISGMLLISLLSSVEDERKGGPDVPREDLK